MIFSLVDFCLLPLPPQSDFFNSAFCKGNLVTLQPARIQTAQTFKNLWAGWGPAAVLFRGWFFFLLFLSFFFFF